MTVVPVDERSQPAPPRLDRRQPPQGRPSDRRPRRPTSTCRTPLAQATPASIATTSRRSAARRVIIDERYNGGGQLADYIIDYLQPAAPAAAVATREGADWTSPSGAIFGPKVMIINELAGSGGDALPWYFRKAGIGPLVGKRTWGGLVGIGGYPELIDGGFVTAPRWALYGPERRLGSREPRRCSRTTT